MIIRGTMAAQLSTRKFISKLCNAGLFTSNAGCIRMRNFASNSCRAQSQKLTWSYHQGAAPSILKGVTIGKQLDVITEKHPDKTAAIFLRQGHRMTFQQMHEEADQLAAGLTALGLKRGDRVGIWAPNCLEWVLTQYATARAGIILVNVNPAYQVRELEYALRKVGMKAIIAADLFKTQDYYKMLNEICPELDTCSPGKLKSKRLPDLKSVIMLGETHKPGAYLFQDVMDSGTSEDRGMILDLQNRLQFDDLINIQFTSGTTGSPKGAGLTHHNIVNNCYFVGRQLEYHKKESRICMPVPLYHCFGMVLGSLQMALHGATLVYPAPSFEPEACLQAVHQERCTALYGTPTMFIDMLDSPNLPNYNVESLSTGIMAGSPCPIEVMKKVRSELHMPDVTICYGTTENSPVTFQSFIDDPIEKRVTTVGQPSPHVEVKVVDTNGEVLPVGETGELLTRGYVVMAGYWDDPEKTSEVIQDDGWYRTGDLCVLDEDGYGRIVGRIKDMIIRGGENIYPTEIEDFLYTHPKVSDVQVVGIPDERLGEEVCAWIKLRENQEATEMEIKEFCKGKISHFKIPKVIRFVNEFPMTVTGKIQKFKMREKMTEQ